MNTLNTFLSNFNDFIWTYILIAVLLALGLYFSIRTKFVQFRYIKEMFRLLGDGIGSKKTKGTISSFQAFCISTASRVGTGNLAGIAIAISLGGPGAIFWMWVIALLGSASSFVESTLAQIFKEKNSDGSFKGGPAYYMEKGLNKKWMGVLFSILITISFGLIFNAVQANTITASFNEAFNVNQTLIALILSVLTIFVIFGGVQRIAKVSEILVPVMAIAYILISLFVILINIKEVPATISLIFKSAFGFEQFAGGTLGGIILVGVKRGLFSNEAGMGSAPNAAATATVSHPVKQGLIQTLGVFTDTLIICSCTAFIILLSGVDYTAGNMEGIQLTQRALSSQIGPFGNTFIAICILLFAFSSIIGNYYYGESNIQFLTSNKKYLFIYRILVIIMIFTGSLSKVSVVWTLADVFMGFMAIVNLIAIFMLGKYAFKALNDYSAQKKAGIKDPVFKKSTIEELEEISEW
ncbi:alanine/glycine:cation symporter family protein [uncultured Clostridium sp.]|uniref:alanine/glycine:cation symporter family protein n=1 Tax=uncultured Clostridium sp. TaxID=59620 RepID=UPI002617DC1C|nr:alanine/glycine:cation symporter family protein [uncultured Clostridium sp.]